jgi:hypothetical protein
LEVEHIIPKTRGGSNRISNLTLACKKCNLKKGNQTAEEFFHPFVQEQALKPLKDAAAVNATRWKIYQQLQATPELAKDLPIECGTGGRTKYNRIKRKLPKSSLRSKLLSLRTYWLDAVCIGESTPETIKVEGIQPSRIVATGRGSRQICSLRSVVYFVNHSG